MILPSSSVSQSSSASSSVGLVQLQHAAKNLPMDATIRPGNAATALRHLPRLLAFSSSSWSLVPLEEGMVVFDAASIGSVFVRKGLSIAKRVPANESTLLCMFFFFFLSSAAVLLNTVYYYKA